MLRLLRLMRIHSTFALMTTFTLNASAERVRDIEMALSALSPLVNKRGRYVHLQLESSGQSIAIPREAVKIVVAVLRQMTQGGTAALIPLDEELTTQQAADMLNVSRPYLIGLLDSGAIPSRKVGKHRRIKALDLIAYKQADTSLRQARLDELTAEAQRLGLGY